MTADTITAIKKALEKVYVGGWYVSHVKTNGLSVVHSASDSSMFGITAETFEAEYVVAANPFAISELLFTLESLQRENERLQAEVDRKSSMPGDHRYWEGRYRDEAAENEKLREALKPFALVAEYDIGDDETDNDRFTPMTFGNCRAKLLTVGDLRRARALSSTGDTNGN